MQINTAPLVPGVGDLPQGKGNQFLSLCSHHNEMIVQTVLNANIKKKNISVAFVVFVLFQENTS